jgi:hypothetical protein
VRAERELDACADAPFRVLHRLFQRELALAHVPERRERAAVQEVDLGIVRILGDQLAQRLERPVQVAALLERPRLGEQVPALTALDASTRTRTRTGPTGRTRRLYCRAMNVPLRHRAGRGCSPPR